MAKRQVHGVLADAMADVYASEFLLDVAPYLADGDRVGVFDPADTAAAPLNPDYSATGATYLPVPYSVAITAGRTTFELLESDDPNPDVRYTIRLRGSMLEPVTVTGIRCPSVAEHPDPLYLWQLINGYRDTPFSPIVRGVVRPSELNATNAPADGYTPVKAGSGDVFRWAQPGGAAAQRVFVWDNASFDPLTHEISVDAADLPGAPSFGQQFFGILPADLPRSDTPIKIRLNTQIPRYLRKNTGAALTTKELTQDELVITMFLAGPTGYRLLVPLTRRPQDYPIYTGWADSGGLDTFTAANFTYHSITPGVTRLQDQPGPAADRYRYLFAVPIDTGDINYFSSAPQGSNQIVALLMSNTIVMLNNVEYKVWIGRGPSSGAIANIDLGIGQVYP